MEDKLLFRTSGFRGKVNVDITPEVALRIGRGFASWIQITYEAVDYFVYVGYDTRRDSYYIAQCIAAALMSSGINVLIFEVPIPTPLVIYATVNNQCHGGVMVTGSHLPAEDNGIILFDHQGSYYKGILNESTGKAQWKDLGKMTVASTEPDEYKIFLLNLIAKLEIKKIKGKVLLDTAHGPMRDYLHLVLSELIDEVILINDEYDDRFPGRPSEPTPKNIESTRKLVIELDCEFGICTDMDGDRVIYITSQGKVITGDYMGAIFAKLLWDKTTNPVVAPINTSSILEYVANQKSGEITYCDVGPPSIIEALRDSPAQFGFEETGKYFFTQTANWPDSAISTIYLFYHLQQKGLTLQELRSELPDLHSIKDKVPAERERSTLLMAKLKEMELKPTLQDWALQVGVNVDENLAGLKITSIDTRDGVRINLEGNAFFMIRPSGTENYIRIFCEHEDVEIVELMQSLGRQLIKQLS